MEIDRAIFIDVLLRHSVDRSSVAWRRVLDTTIFVLDRVLDSAVSSGILDGLGSQAVGVVA